MSDNWGEKIIKQAVIGFLTGILAGNLITVVSSLIARNETVWVTESLVQKAGSLTIALVLQSFLSGIIGTAGVLGMNFYDIDGWSMLKAALVHYMMILVVFLPIAVFLGWSELKPAPILTMAGIMAVFYFIIWIIMFLYYRRQVREMNSLRNSEIRK